MSSLALISPWRSTRGTSPRAALPASPLGRPTRAALRPSTPPWGGGARRGGVPDREVRQGARRADPCRLAPRRCRPRRRRAFGRLGKAGVCPVEAVGCAIETRPTRVRRTFGGGLTRGRKSRGGSSQGMGEGPCAYVSATCMTCVPVPVMAVQLFPAPEYSHS